MGPIKFAGATRMLRQAGEQQRQLINAEGPDESVDLRVEGFVAARTL
jgi:hypothetical protein